MLNPDSILSQLIMVMVRAYWDGFHRPGQEWVLYKELCQITPRYSQSFGDWRKYGIETEKKPDGAGGYLYRLKTCPDSIDWDGMRLQFSDRTIRTKVEKVPQGNLF